MYNSGKLIRQDTDKKLSKHHVSLLSLSLYQAQANHLSFDLGTTTLSEPSLLIFQGVIR